MKSLVLFILLTFNQAHAVVDRALGTSPRGLLMGNAYTAIADDEYTLFYNPAILARHKGFSFYPINPQFRASNVLDDPDRFTDIGSDPNDFADAAFDYPVHLGTDFTPTLKMGYFGFSGLYQSNTNMNLQNQVNPSLDIDHRSDTGFIAGFAYPLFGNFTSEGGGNHLALGASLKYLKRESVYGSYDLTGLTLLDALQAGEIDQVLDQLGKVNGQGWGFDFGLDYANSSGGSTFTAGLVFLDVVTTLQTEDNINDFEVQDQPMQVHFGTAWKGSMGAGFDVTVSADIRNLSRQMELARRIHLGTEVGVSPAFSFYAGVNAVDNYSYGLKFNAGLINLMAGFYGQEIGQKLGQQESNRAVIYLSLFDFTFNP